MKKIFIVSVITVLSLGCNAQSSRSTIIPLNEEPINRVPNAYYIDSNNDLDKFQGTWVWQNGLSFFKIVLIKKTHVYVTDKGSYYDMLVGEYQYVDASGTSIINTIPLLSCSPDNPLQRNIKGNFIIDQMYLPPNSLPVNVEYSKVWLFLIDPLRTNFIGRLKMRYVDSTIPKIQIQLYDYTTDLIDDGEPLGIRIPEGNYTLVKQ